MERIWDKMRIPLGLIIAVGLLGLALRQLDMDEFRQALSDVRWAWLLLAWVGLLVGTALKARRSQVLLEAGGYTLSWGRLLVIFATGQMVNVVIPTRLGELSRAFLVSRISECKVSAGLGIILVEKALDGLALAAMTVVVALYLALPGWFTTAVYTFSIILLALVSLILLAIFQRVRLLGWSRRLPVRFQSALGAGLEGLAVLSGPKVIVQGTLNTVGIWALSVMTNFLAFRALDLAPTVQGAALLVVVYYMAVLIPGVPAQVGLFHYVTVLTLGLFAYSRTSAMSYAIVLHAMIYGTMMILGMVSVSWLSLDLGDFIRRVRALSTKVRTIE